MTAQRRVNAFGGLCTCGKWATSSTSMDDRPTEVFLQKNLFIGCVNLNEFPVLNQRMGWYLFPSGAGGRTMVETA